MSERETVVSTLIKASHQAVYRAFLDRDALAARIGYGLLRLPD
jgi:hypothetical protein